MITIYMVMFTDDFHDSFLIDKMFSTEEKAIDYIKESYPNYTRKEYTHDWYNDNGSCVIIRPRTVL